MGIWMENVRLKMYKWIGSDYENNKHADSGLFFVPVSLLLNIYIKMGSTWVVLWKTCGHLGLSAGIPYYFYENTYYASS